jgi:plastocyanin
MRKAVFGLAALLILAPAFACAEDAPMTLTIKEHVFNPTEVKVKANTRVQLMVVNEDATPEEFDSSALKVEKVIAGKSKGIVRIGPLKPGRYPFIGEYHESTAKGVVIVE